MLIANLNRVQLLSVLPSGGTIVGVGDAHDAFPRHIVRVVTPEKLHLIDPGVKGDQQPTRAERRTARAIRGEDRDSLHDAIAAGHVVLHNDSGPNIAATFDDHSLDWVYLDGRQDYDSVRADLLAFKDKVKLDGFILGHDFSSYRNPQRYGVIPAVREFIRSEGFDLVLLTNETNPTYLLARSGNKTALPALRSALLSHRASPPIELDESLLGGMQQIHVVPAGGGRGQSILQFGARPGNGGDIAERVAEGTDGGGISDVGRTGAERRSGAPADHDRVAAPQVSTDLFLSLLKRNLTRTLADDDESARRALGRGVPADSETMVGLRRLDNIEHCITDVLHRGVPGDLVETGVWRGGATIFMRAVLKAYGATDRTVWVADSFAGLPPPDPERFPDDARSRLYKRSELAVSVDEVKANFARYGLLDDQVRFLVGWFKDTLPAAPIDQLAVLRLDGDMYESTIVALEALYPRLASGGYLIVDDYGAIRGCRQAVEDYRAEHGVSEPMEQIDWTGVFWQKRA